MLGALLTKWTIRLALLCLVGALAGKLLLRPPLGGVSEDSCRRRLAPDGAAGTSWLPAMSERPIRLLWTLGCALFVLHVAAAFHFYHHWSHEHAWLDTARQTEELLGWSFGSGIYFSYLFLLLWVADVIWWWIAPVSHESRSAWLDRIVLAYLLFIAFNGAAIFERGVTRWGAIVSCIVLGGLLAQRLRLRGNSARLAKVATMTESTRAEPSRPESS